MNRMGIFKRSLVEHVTNHLSIYIFTVVLLSMGVIFGAVIVNSLSFSQKNDLYAYLTLFFGQVEEGEFANSSTMFVQSFAHYSKYLGLMWFLGLSVIGLPVIYILLFLKGLVVGFTVGFLVGQMGLNGFFLSFAAIFPQNVLLIPIYIVVATVATSFSIKLWRQVTRRGFEPMFPHFMSYSFFLLFIGALIAIVSLFEAYVSPSIMQAVFQILG
ncbi:MULTISPECIES: stage II sporulation protein M [Bacillaceae]|uniref:Stage II sporulation protein M n=1 Tax=Evansella alkalicola TaxID=745819 RepID=A0ABS6JZL9_9BACI|nr:MULTISPECIES: stage II sporulation protein M [Bacillaceae]MBU9724040.1 stage II sporulation protein M [Bacillus alkalicola]